MLQFIQSLLLSEVLIFIVLFAVFGLLTRWAIWRLHEYAGYALGWLLGLFFVFVYSSLMSSPPTFQAESAPGEITLNVWQVIVPSVLGLVIGLFSLILTRLGGGSSVQQALKIAGFTALGVVLLFLMFVEGPGTRRMIGIFALAFGIASLLGLVLARRSVATQVVPPTYTSPRSTQEIPTSRLESIRQQMRDRDQNP